MRFRRMQHAFAAAATALVLAGCGESEDGAAKSAASLAGTWAYDADKSLTFTSEGDFNAKVKLQPISGTYALEESAIVFSYTSRGVGVAVGQDHTTRCGYSLVNDGKGLKLNEPCELAGRITGVRFDGILSRQ